VNPTVVMTEMGKIGWSDPEKAKSMTSRIPLGKFAGKPVFVGHYNRRSNLHSSFLVFHLVVSVNLS